MERTKIYLAPFLLPVLPTTHSEGFYLELHSRVTFLHQHSSCLKLCGKGSNLAPLSALCAGDPVSLSGNDREAEKGGTLRGVIIFRTFLLVYPLQGVSTLYPPSMTGVGLGPESSGGLGVPGVLGDREGRRVAGVASMKLRSSFVTTGVAAAGVATTWVLEEVQQFRSTSRSGGRHRDPMA